ncbi:MAG: phosphatidylglycerophosphatase A [Puniceicoccales bacterium]|jgi:phosphatidylglycerophosphatase A|nr:phosphatidylglycerophosphatase A [Puniceicoccales bacterium]
MRHLLRTVPTRWILNCATLGPVGYVGKMPGTLGSFIGLIYYTLLFHSFAPANYLLGCLISFYLACVICDEAEIILRKKDPSCVILDEIVAMPFCFIGLQKSMQQYPVWLFMLLGFILFRIFDILKPLGIKRIQTLKGGLGIVLDDVVAALIVCIILHILFRVIP